MLKAGIERCAHRMAALDIALNGPVAVLIRNPIRHLTLCFALFRLGIASISLEHAQTGIGRLKFAAVLGDDAENVVDPANRVIAITDDWFGTDRPGETKFGSGFSAAAQLCRASLTSGSTGAPKIVNHTGRGRGEADPTVYRDQLERRLMHARALVELGLHHRMCRFGNRANLVVCRVAIASDSND
jgi:acyl-CoA synthetase (AMP-forming)/AMP-acid ligase II